MAAGAPPQWEFDALRRLWYGYDPATNERVYENDLQIPRLQPEPRTISATSLDDLASQAAPRHLPGSDCSSTPQPSTDQALATTTYHHSSQPALTAASRVSFLESGPTPATGPSTPWHYERNGVQMASTRDFRSRVETVYGTMPKERITDPHLLVMGVHAHRILVGTRGQSEPLYPDFKLQRSSFFSVGRVLSVLLAEPAEETRSLRTDYEVADALGDGMSTGKYNVKVFSKVRRFVVLRAGVEYCSALAVMSYGRRGVGKPDVTKHEHAIIYSTVGPPEPHQDEMPLRGELPMRPYAIRVVPDSRLDKLDPMSRIDFGKVHTIHHNIKTKSFGMVHEHSMQALTTQFANVWLHTWNSPPSRAPQMIPSSGSSVGGKCRAETGRSGEPQPGKSVTSRRLYVKQPLGASQRHNIDDDEEDDDDSDDSDDSDVEDDDDEEDDADEEHEEGPSGRPEKSTRVCNSASTSIAISQNAQDAKRASEAIKRLRGNGYTRDQAFTIMMAKLQSDRNLTREATHRLLQDWTGSRMSDGMSHTSGSSSGIASSDVTTVPRRTDFSQTSWCK